MDFTNFKTTKQANALRFEENKEEIIEKKVDKKDRKMVPDPALSLYKKVYQYCDTCKRGINFNIIFNKVVCSGCNNSYMLQEK